jgi:ribosomal protein S18 acetylase RimI-like enzyme
MEIRQLTWTQRQPAAQCLAQAFELDPLMVSLLPDPRTRCQRLSRFCGLVVQHGLRYGEVYASGEELCGVAIWLPPQQVHVSLPRLLYSGGWLLPFRVGIRGTWRMLAFRSFADRRWRQLADSPHWLLHMLGVAPPYQGQGHASRLLASMLQRLDQRRVACALETANARNTAIYERFGFRVLEQTQPPRNKLICWFMLRAPGVIGQGAHESS